MTAIKYVTKSKTTLRLVIVSRDINWEMTAKRVKVMHHKH